MGISTLSSDPMLAVRAWKDIGEKIGCTSLLLM
jgi:hypothetical protein